MRFKHIQAAVTITLIFISILFFGCQKKTSYENKSQMIGVKIYNIEGDINKLFDEWKSLGINTVFAGVDLITDEFRNLAKKQNIKVFIILPIFYDPDTLAISPELYAITDQGGKAKEEWVEFVCPSRRDYRKKKIQYIKTLIHNLHPDGISLDFIRHFVFWEKVYPHRKADYIPNTCFDSHCMTKFQSDTDISIPDSLIQASEISEWIEANCPTQWTDWKCDLITEMIREITSEVKKIDPKILVNVHAVPWRRNDFDGGIRNIVGQNFSDIGEIVDMISPMTYAHMVKREPEWINSVVKDIAAQTKCKIIPSIQVNKAYLTEPLRIDEFKQSVVNALAVPSAGVIFWSWEQIDASPEKKELFSSLLRDN